MDDDLPKVGDVFEYRSPRWPNLDGSIGIIVREPGDWYEVRWIVPPTGCRSDFLAVRHNCYKILLEEPWNETAGKIPEQS